MMNINSVNISIDSNLFLIIAGVLLFAVYTFFIYKYTIPAISRTLKYFLFVLRGLTLALLFILLFDPIFVVTSEEKLPPVNYIFVDNSASIVQHDSVRTASDIKKAVVKITTDLKDKSKIFTFGGSVKEQENNSAEYLDFTDRFTGLDKIPQFADQAKENLTSIILISDGIITTGSNPIPKIENMSIPYTVIGVGDSTKYDDIETAALLTNTYIYSGKKTTVEAVILNKGFSNEIIRVDLIEDNKLIDTRNVTLNASGVNRVKFEYVPAEPGEKKITVNAGAFPKEISSENNSKTVYRSVLNSKVKIALVSDSPSPDLSFIKNSIERDENYEVISLVTVSQNVMLNDKIPASLDSVNIFLLVGYPSAISSGELLKNISNQIIQKQKPFFIILTAKTDFKNLSQFAGQLPFSIPIGTTIFERAQIETADNLNPILQINGKYEPEYWNNLPPVIALTSNFTARPESNIIARLKLKNISTDIPFLLSRSAGKSRSISLSGYEIWRWKLQEKNNDVFDQFIRNVILWLKVDPDAEKFKITSDKRIYATGEEMEFTGEIYDEKLTPIPEAEISVELNYGESKEEVFLSLDENGFYTGRTIAKKPGDLTYKGIAKLNGKIIGGKNGKLTVENINAELVNLTMDKGMLNDIALVSGGRYYNINEMSNITEKINEYNSTRTITKYLRNEYNLRSTELLLIILLLLFSLEWLFRKRSGML